MKHANKGIYPGFETQGKHHHKSKIGVSVRPLKKDCCPPKLYFKTRMHSNRMRTTRSSSHLGGSPPVTPLGADPPGSRPPARHAGIPPAMQAGIATSWRPAARHAGIPPAMHAGIAHPPVNRMTDKCKNITLPQTLFAGGYKGEGGSSVPKNLRRDYEAQTFLLGSETVSALGYCASISDNCFSVVYEVHEVYIDVMSATIIIA